jgi:hypothetical protein
MQDQWTMRSSVQRTGDNRNNLGPGDRGQPISGLFSDDDFALRCVDHEYIRLGAWSSLNGDPSATPTGAAESKAGSFSSIVSRMKSMVSRSPGNDATIAPTHRSITVAVSATSAPAAHLAAQDVYSNQMSS